MRTKKLKIVIDTNLFISYLIGKLLINLTELITSERVEVYTSREQLTEIYQVVTRPKFSKFFSRQKVDDLILLLDEIADVVEVTSDLKLCRDPKDDFLINLAVDSKADFLITGDKDLLILKEFGNMKIVNYTDFNLSNQLQLST